MHNPLTLSPDQVVEPDVSQVWPNVLHGHFEELILSNGGNGCTFLGRKKSKFYQGFLLKDRRQSIS